MNEAAAASPVQPIVNMGQGFLSVLALLGTNASKETNADIVPHPADITLRSMSWTRQRKL